MPNESVENEYRNQSKDVLAFVQRQERDTFGARQLDKSRSRSRDRDEFSESVWDRSEVEGPASSGSDREREKEREKRDRICEMRQVEREKESNKVYQPAPPKIITVTIERKDRADNHEIPTGSDGKYSQQVMLLDSNNMKATKLASNFPTSIESSTPATFRTHMAQKYEKERKRKFSASSTTVSQSTRRGEETDGGDEWPLPAIPAPVPAPPSLKNPANACLTYNRVPWKLRVRKEVFHPTESIGPPIALDLLFAQVSSDIFGLTPSLRISPQEKAAAINMLNGHGVSVELIRSQNVRAIVKRHLIDMREWPLLCSSLPARRDADYLIVVQSVPLNEIQNAVTLPRPASLQLSLMNGKNIQLHAARAAAIQAMITSFIQDYRKGLKINVKHDSSVNISNIARTASIDSLNNLTDIDSFNDHDTTATNTTAAITTSTANNTNDNYSDSDDTETAHVTGTTSVQVHRRIDLDQLTDETIREFNEQCSSLSHDMEFYNSWQNEEELEQCSMNKESNECVCQVSSQEDIKEYQQTSLNHINTRDSNNNECSSFEANTNDWLDKLEMEDVQSDKLPNLTDGSLSQIQKVANNITKLNISSIKDVQLKADSNEVESYSAADDLINTAINQGVNVANGNASKTRRSSVASSGSVGRMETILKN
ncbi:Unconventional myosin-XV [Eumeta japonica]|uniref:Unconventional myosin-XV n=1 Tax=Eumeta variegata TaxID=151549 RepID=A0A4C1SXA6_EUMVA|nr:Unconventional myosin-XV [Eumeta japonica]